MSNQVVSGTNLVVSGSSIGVKGFEETVLKAVKVIEREGKKPLVFVDLMDFKTFDTTGEMMFMNKDMSIDLISSLKALEKKLVKAVLFIGTYNGKTSINVNEIIPAV
jgi:hypothetical protein